MAAVDQGDVLDTRAAGGLVIRGGALRAGGYFVTTALSVVSFALITRHLGVVRFGDYQTLLSIVTIVAAITDAGMATLGVREYATLRGEERERLMRNLLGARLALTGVGVVAAAAVAAGLGFEAALVVGTALAGIGIGFNVVQSMVAVPLLATLRVGTTTGLEIGRQVVLVAVLVTVVLAGGGVVSLLAATIPAGLAALVGTVLFVRGETSLRPSLHATEWGRLLRLTLPVALTVTAGTLYVFLAQVLTDTIATEQESGVFAASFRVFLVVGAIPGVVVSTAFPLLARAARDDSERLAYAIDRLFRSSVLAGGFVFVLLVAGVPAAIEIVAGPAFAEAVPVLRIQSIALLASFGLATLSFALLTLRLHREILLANLAGLIVSATLVIGLAADEGATGAAWATVGGEAVLVTSCWLLLRIRRPAATPALRTILPVVIPLAGGLGVALIPGVASVPLTLMAGAAYLVLALVTRALPPELLQALRRR